MTFRPLVVPGLFSVILFGACGGPVPGPGGAGLPAGAACEAYTDCCSGDCNNGVCAGNCACANLGHGCGPAPCCNGACANGVCVCLAATAQCNSGPDCCSGNCHGNVCQ